MKGVKIGEMKSEKQCGLPTPRARWGNRLRLVMQTKEEVILCEGKLGILECFLETNTS